jgi:DNA ligase-associated metallophosphoesterase
LIQTIATFDSTLQLLPEKAVYSDRHRTLFVADLHLGKAETFQRFGIPVPSQVNQTTLHRLRQLCDRFSPLQLVILGDLFHSNAALSPEVMTLWMAFCEALQSTYQTTIQLVIGNHDQRLIEALNHENLSWFDQLCMERLLLTHEPNAKQGWFNLCGHVHPCVRLQTRLDRLRLPCFFLDKSQDLLMLPSFGEFTGGYEVVPGQGAIAYAIAEGHIIPIAESAHVRGRSP